MAFPQVVSSTSGNTGTINVTTHVVNLPSGLVNGNKLLLFIANDGAATLSVTTPASGWSELVTGVIGTSNRLTVFTRTIDGTEGSTITITSSAKEQTSYTIYQISGHADEFDFSTAATGTSTSPDAGSLNPAGWDVEDTLWFVAYGWDSSPTHSAYPSNYSSNQLNATNGTAAGCGVASATRELASSSEDPGAGTISASDGWVAFTVAVRPSGGGTPSGSGSITAIGTLSGVGTSTRSGSGTISAVGTLSGVGLSVRSGSSSITAIGSLAGAGVSTRSGSGSINAIGTLSGAGEAPTLAATGSGTITAIASLSGVGTSVRSGTGTIDAIGTLAGVGVSARSGTGSITAIGTLAGVGTAPSVGGASGSGTILAIGTLAGVGTSTRSGSGNVSAIGAMVAAGITARSGSGSLNAVARLNGVGSNGESTTSPAFLYYYYLAN